MMPCDGVSRDGVNVWDELSAQRTIKAKKRAGFSNSEIHRASIFKDIKRESREERIIRGFKCGRQCREGTCFWEIAMQVQLSNILA